jgi:hypothetical protein
LNFEDIKEQPFEAKQDPILPILDFVACFQGTSLSRQNPACREAQPAQVARL